MVDCDYFWCDPLGLPAQARYGAVYVLGVDVITEEVEAIDVDLNLCIEMFDFDCGKKKNIPELNHLQEPFVPDAGVAWFKHERQVMKQ